MEKKNLDFDLAQIFETFQLVEAEKGQELENWTSASYELDVFEQQIVNDLHEEISVAGDHMNEEELKAKLVSLIFYVSKIQVQKKIMVFYERALSGIVENISLSVVCDCMVASPIVGTPKHPYFFLQEFKKKKGEKKDPEAQMLVAMLIAQQKNQDNKTIYGGYLVGTSWKFTTLSQNEYCVSRIFEATNKNDLMQIVFILRKLKEIILNR